MDMSAKVFSRLGRDKGMTSLHRDSQAGTSFAVSRRTLMMGLTMLMGVIVLDAGLAS
jgi:hypothetical protein